MHLGLFGNFGIPGFLSEYVTQVSDVEWGNTARRQFRPAVISGATRDAGNTPTTLLRPGLILAATTALPDTLIPWAPTATDGSQHIKAVLIDGQDTQFAGSNADRYIGALYAGNVKASKLIVPGQSSAGLSGQTYEYVAYNLMRENFRFDTPSPVPPGRWRRVRTVTADYTVTAADSGTMFVSRGTGAVVFTLPTLLEALEFGFFNAVDYDMTVASATTGKLITFNDIAANSVAFSTSGEKIGGSLEILGLADGFGLVVLHTNETQTPVVAT